MIDEALAGRYQAHVVSSTPLSTRATLIRVLVEGSYLYRAGQYVAVSFGPETADSYYSFASAPEVGCPSEFELCVSTDGKPELEKALVPGAPLIVTSPLGGVRFSPRSARPLWLLGIGTGVAPLRAIVQDLTADLARVSLVVGQRDARGSLFHEEFERLRALGLDYRPFVSQESGVWSGGRGRIQDEVARLIEAQSTDLLGVHAVVCGTEVMAESVSRLLIDAGVPEPQIHQEGHSSAAHP